jgi:hypothetical protein
MVRGRIRAAGEPAKVTDRSQELLGTPPGTGRKATVMETESTSSGEATGFDAECQRAVAQLTRFGPELAQADVEREYLRVHTQNLEAELRRVLHERDVRIEELEAALAHAQAELRRVLRERDVRIEELEAALAHAEAVHRLVVTSRSWRLTASVRAAARAVRQVSTRTRPPKTTAEP